MENKQFFETLNENIKKSTTEKALKNMERLGENYTRSILKNPNISSKIKSDTKRELKNSRKLIQKIRKNIKE